MKFLFFLTVTISLGLVGCSEKDPQVNKIQEENSLQKDSQDQLIAAGLIPDGLNSYIDLNRKVKVQYQGEFKSERPLDATLVFSHNNVDFGDLLTEQTIGARISVKNIGVDTAKNIQLNFSGDIKVLSNRCQDMTLQSGESCSFRLFYKAGIDLGEKIGKVTAKAQESIKEIVLESKLKVVEKTSLELESSLGTEIIFSTIKNESIRNLRIINRGPGVAEKIVTKLNSSEFEVRSNGCENTSLAKGQYCTVSLIFHKEKHPKKEHQSQLQVSVPRETKPLIITLKADSREELLLAKEDNLEQDMSSKSIVENQDKKLPEDELKAPKLSFKTFTVQDNGQSQKNIENKVADILKKQQEEIDKKKQQDEIAKQKALEEKAKAEELARQKNLEEQKKLEELKKQELAKKALEEKLKAEELAKQKALEEKLKSEELAKQKALEEKQKTEELAKQKALEEKLKAEELAKQKALEEKLKAEQLVIKQKEDELFKKKTLEEKVKADQLAKEKALEEQQKEELAKQKALEEKLKLEQLAKQKALEEKQAQEILAKKQQDEIAKQKALEEKLKLEELAKQKQLEEKRQQELTAQMEAIKKEEEAKAIAIQKEQELVAQEKAKKLEQLMILERQQAEEKIKLMQMEEAKRLAVLEEEKQQMVIKAEQEKALIEQQRAEEQKKWQEERAVLALKLEQEQKKQIEQGLKTEELAVTVPESAVQEIGEDTIIVGKKATIAQLDSTQTVEFLNSEPTVKLSSTSPLELSFYRGLVPYGVYLQKSEHKEELLEAAQDLIPMLREGEVVSQKDLLEVGMKISTQENIADLEREIKIQIDSSFENEKCSFNGFFSYLNCLTNQVSLFVKDLINAPLEDLSISVGGVKSNSLNISRYTISQVSQQVIPTSQNIKNQAIYNGEFYFQAKLVSQASKLFKISGYNLLQISNTNPNGDDSPWRLVVHNGELYFSALNSQGHSKLYKTNGKKIIQLSNIFPEGNDYLAPAIVYNNELYLEGMTKDGFLKLYKTDGKKIIQVSDTNPSGSDAPSDFMVYQNSLYFRADNMSGHSKLFKLNQEGMAQVSNLNQNQHDAPEFLEIYNGELYFSAYLNGIGSKLFKTDGKNLYQVGDITKGGNDEPSDLKTFNEYLYFIAVNQEGRRKMFRTDGKIIEQISDIRQGFGDFAVNYREKKAYMTVFNGELFFVAKNVNNGFKIFKTNGDRIAQVSDINQVHSQVNPTGSDFPFNLMVYNNELYFSAYGNSSGLKLFKMKVENTKKN